jgi:hypothetical protein
MLALTHADGKANAKSANKEQPQNSSYKVQRMHAVVLLQSGSNRLRSCIANSVAVLQNSCWPSRTATKTINLTSRSIFTLLISPVFMRAANATQSASVTPQSLAWIVSLSTSNSLIPNFIFSMEHADADVRRKTLSSKLAGMTAVDSLP